MPGFVARRLLYLLPVLLQTVHKSPWPPFAKGAPVPEHSQQTTESFLEFVSRTRAVTRLELRQQAIKLVFFFQPGELVV